MAAVVVVVAVAAAVAAFGGFARLVRRSPTLDGSISLRATQGCVPLLEGNELGHQVVLTRPLRVDRKFGHWHVRKDELWATFERARRAALPMLHARDLLPRDAWPELGRGVITTKRGRLWLWTGLCVRPRPGAWLLVTSVANRRRRSFVVCERAVPDAGGWVPLVLELRPVAGVDTIELHGEVACIVVVEPGLALDRVSLADRPEAAQAHMRFYTQDYFEAKKRGDITRRYRKAIDGSHPVITGDGRGAVVEVGPCPGEIETLSRCLLPSGPSDQSTSDHGGLRRARFDNLIEFSARWDGYAVSLKYDRARLRELSAGIEPTFEAVLGREIVAVNPGALLYLSKYFTPHPPGEPHFFVKPWAFTMLPPGWSALVDGVHGCDYDIMRGVVHADQFFATPAVFHLFTLDQPIDVPAGWPLLRVTPIPRTRLKASAAVTMLDGISWS